uniref:UDENN domain-containing protein n=1 Tax=Heterorhabditis bacteriophora TaxID=37862 RepID=A0A1I7XDV4_HETBA
MCLLLAPTPFVIGVPASFFAHKRIKEIPSDVILVDLDTNHINIPEELFIPDLPESDASTLKVKFFNAPNIFGDFSEHTRTLRLYPRPVVALQSESFLRSRPQCTQFITDLCRTQAVEYFAECCLCPKNETFVRVQAGIDSAVQVGDKSKWFSDALMPVHFMVSYKCRKFINLRVNFFTKKQQRNILKVYPNDSSLCSAYYAYGRDGGGVYSDSDDDGSHSIESSSSIDDLVFDSPEERSGEHNNVYKIPLILNDSGIFMLAFTIKSKLQGAFSFDHGDDEEFEMTPVSQRRKTVASEVSTPTSVKTPPLKGMRIKGFSTFTDSDNSQSNKHPGSHPAKLKLMEDESLRELVCSKLNLGLEHRLSDEEYVKEIGNDITSPSSSTPSTLVTPSASANDLKELVERSSRPKLPTSTVDIRTPTKPVGTQNPVNGSSPKPSV